MADLKLNFSFFPGVAQTLEKAMTRLLEELEGRLPRSPAPPDDDPDFVAWWESSLRERFAADAEVLRAVFEDSDFGEGSCTVSVEKADSLMRACSGLRLAIRQTALGQFSDEALEAGAVTPTAVRAEHHEALFCFWFLGLLQEAVIQALNNLEGLGEA